MLRYVIQKATRNGDLEQTSDNSLVEDEGFETVIAISFFTDARATADELAKYGKEQRGYWLDAFEEDLTLNTGSKLWLLAGAVINDENIATAKTFCDEALAWFVADGAALKIENTVERFDEDSIAGQTAIYRPTDPKSPYLMPWEAFFAV